MDIYYFQLSKLACITSPQIAINAHFTLSTHYQKAPARKSFYRCEVFLFINGFEQVSIDDGEDIRNLRLVDQKLWVALGCPAQGIEFDRKTIDCLDTNQEGHIRVPEVLAATDWPIACSKIL